MVNSILEPGEEPDHQKCNCEERDRWRLYARAMGTAAAVLLTGCIVMGWALASRARTIHVLEDRLATTPADVIARLKTTPADVLVRIEKLERELAIKPADVLKEVIAMRAELKLLRDRLEN